MTETSTLPLVSSPSPGAMPEAAGTDVSTWEVVSRSYTSSTGLGSAIKYVFAPEAREGFSTDFNSWDYIATLGDEDRQLAFDNAHRMGLLVSPEAVDARLARLKDHLRTSTVMGKSSTGQFLLGMGASFLDVSTFVPVAGVLGKVGIGAKAASNALKYAAVGAGSAALDEAVIAGTQEVYDPRQAFLAIGTGTLLGAGLGSFARLYNTPERAARSTQAFEEVAEETPVHPRDPDFDEGSAGAAYRPQAGQQRAVDELNEGFSIKGTVVDPIFNAVASGTKLLALTPAQFVRRYQNKARELPTVTRFMQTLVDIEGAVKGADKRARTIQSEKFLLERTRTAIETAYRRAYSQLSAELGGSPHQFGVRGAVSRAINGRPALAEEDFGIIVAKKLRDRNFVYAGDVRIDKYASEAAKGYQEMYRTMLRRSGDAGLQKTNKIRKLEARAEALKAKVAEKTTAVSQTPSGRARKTGTKAHAEAVEKLKRAEARLERATKKIQDMEDYLPQIWMKRAIRRGDRARFVDILKRNFVRRAMSADGPKIDAEMVRSVLVKQGKSASDDDVEILMDAFEDQGWAGLPQDVVDEMRNFIEVHAEASADAVHRSFRSEKGRQIDFGEIDPEFSSRFQGRKLDLDEEAFEEMVKDGFLSGDPNLIGSQYVRDVGAKTVMKERLGTVDPLNDLESDLAKALDEEINAGKLKDGEASEIREYIQAMVDRTLGYSDYTGSEVGRYFRRNLTRYTGTVLTGTAGFTALSDLFGQVLVQGVGGTAVGIFRSTVGRALKDWKGNNDEALASLIGLDMALGAIRPRAWIGDVPTERLGLERGIGVGMTNKVTGLVDKGTENMYSAMQYLNLNQPLTLLYRAQGGLWLMEKIVSGKIDDTLMTHMKRLGLDETDIRKLQAAPRHNAASHRGLKFDLIDIAELAKTDRDLADTLEIALDRNARIMSVQIGDGTLAPMFDSQAVKILMQFGQYMSAMTDNVFRNNLKYGVMPENFSQAMGLITMLGIGMMIDPLKSIARGQPTNMEEKFADPARVAGTVYDAIDRTGMLGLLSPYSKFLAQMGANTFDIDLFGGSGRYRDVKLPGLLLGPSFSMLERGNSVLSGIQANEPDAVLYHTLRLMPFSTVAGVSALVNQARP